MNTNTSSNRRQSKTTQKTSVTSKKSSVVASNIKAIKAMKASKGKESTKKVEKSTVDVAPKQSRTIKSYASLHHFLNSAALYQLGNYEQATVAFQRAMAEHDAPEMLEKLESLQEKTEEATDLGFEATDGLGMEGSSTEQEDNGQTELLAMDEMDKIESDLADGDGPSEEDLEEEDFLPDQSNPIVQPAESLSSPDAVEGQEVPNGWSNWGDNTGMEEETDDVDHIDGNESIGVKRTRQQALTTTKQLADMDEGNDVGAFHLANDPLQSGEVNPDEDFVTEFASSGDVMTGDVNDDTYLEDLATDKQEHPEDFGYSVVDSEASSYKKQVEMNIAAVKGKKGKTVKKVSPKLTKEKSKANKLKLQKKVGRAKQKEKATKKKQIVNSNIQALRKSSEKTRSCVNTTARGW